MFETAELGRRVSKAEYRKRAPTLREALLRAQVRLREADFPVIVLFAGVDGAGKGETVNLLNQWMDPRWIQTRSFAEPTEEERTRPEYWRYWRGLPPTGQIGLLLSAWYSPPLLCWAYEEGDDRFEDALSDIVTFESMLADDGALILKFWLHLGKRAQEERFRALEADPLESWRVTEQDWRHWRLYDRFAAAGERIIARTSTGAAPWHIVEGSDAGYRSLRVGELLLEGLQKHLELRAHPAHRKRAAPRPPAASHRKAVTVLDTLDLSRRLAKPEYRRRLAELQGRLNRLHREARERGLATLLVFEGRDAAGKGGAIRRIAAALDARSLQIVPVGPPTDEERAHHYLWRFWRQLPRPGRVTVFDRSWYGRVLVERIEGLARAAEWGRAYAEINLFERQLVEHGMLLLKYWIHISKDEQKRRFQRRSKTAYKRWKLTAEDWRNRKRWAAYEVAAHDMVERTSTRVAPWILVEGNDKRFARIEVLERLCERLEAALGAAAPREIA